MKKETVTFTYDAEKLAALKMYMAQKNIRLEDEPPPKTNILAFFISRSAKRDFLFTHLTPKRFSSRFPLAVRAQILYSGKLFSALKTELRKSASSPRLEKP